MKVVSLSPVTQSIKSFEWYYPANLEAIYFVYFFPLNTPIYGILEVRFKRGQESVGVWSLTKMKKFGLRFACGIVLSSLTWNASATTTFAQCACAGSSQGIQYGATDSNSTILGQEALLDNVDNPAEMITFTVIVPEKAIVSFNGEPTFTKGSVRNYVVRGLKAGKTYKFDVTGLLVNEFGAEYAAKEEVKVAAGETKQVVLQLRRQKRAPAPPAPFPPAPLAAAPGKPA